MGCGNPKEKLEDEIMKAKMARIELQMERYNQLKLLKNNYGKEMQTPLIPDYIDPDFLKDFYLNRQNSHSTTHKINTSQTGIRQKRSKTCNMKKRISEGDKKDFIRTKNKRISCKKRTLKI